jgi:hypothetical protein
VGALLSIGVFLLENSTGCSPTSIKKDPAPVPNNPTPVEVTPSLISKTSELIGAVAYAIPMQDVPTDVEWKGDISSSPTDITWQDQDTKVQLRLTTENELDVQFTNGSQVAVMPVWHAGTDPAGTWVLSDGFNGEKYVFTDKIVAKIGFSCGDEYVYLRLTPNGWQFGAASSIGACDAVPTLK